MTMREDGRDEWATPPHVFQAICDHWGVQPTIDLCADETNAKCLAFINWQTNALKVSWFAGIHTCGWMNPPYSQPEMTEFIEKAIEQSLKGFTTVFLLPAFVDQPWYHDLIKPFPHEFWRGRIKHLPPPGIKPSSPRNGSVHGVIKLAKLTWRDVL